jgi:hypothetical protein
MSGESRVRGTPHSSELGGASDDGAEELPAPYRVVIQITDEWSSRDEEILSNVCGRGIVGVDQYGFRTEP